MARARSSVDGATHYSFTLANTGKGLVIDPVQLMLARLPDLPAKIDVECSMDWPLQPPTAREFFDRRRTPKEIAMELAAAAVIALLLYLGIQHSGYLLRHGQFAVLAFCWGSVAVIIACLPQTFRGWVERYRGRPVLRLDQRGLWLRDRESWGWIAWADVAEIFVDTSAISRRLSLRLRDWSKYFERMSWIDRLAAMASWSFEEIIDTLSTRSATAKGRTIAVTDFDSIGTQWDLLVAALDPFLAEHRIPKRERSEPGPASAEPTTPSALVAQFPDGGPQLRALIAKLVEVEPTIAEDVVRVARAASPAQQDSIGAGLADASRSFVKLGGLDWARDSDAHIRQAMSTADDRTRAAWSGAEPPTPIPSPVT
jgi:hypothetical protein